MRSRPPKHTLVVLSAVLWTLGVVGPAFGATYWVCPDGSGDFTTIQEGINAAAEGDTVLLCCDQEFVGDGNRDITFSGNNIVLMSACGEPDRCVIDLGGPGDEHFGFQFHADQDPATVLAGVTIRDGYHPQSGGGIRIDGCSPTVRNCIITDCYAPRSAGGVYLKETEALLSHCEISNCHCDGLDSPAHGGGALEIAYAHPTLEHCTLVYNSCTMGEFGGAIHSWRSAPEIQNTIIALSEGVAVACHQDSVPHLSCCDVWGNTGGDWVDCIGDQYGTEGNISEDPMFCGDLGVNPYHLYGESPCGPEYNPACGLIGAYPAGCLDEAPYLQNVVDVANDQGRQVRLTWTRSMHDAPGEPVITGYAVYREQGAYSDAGVDATREEAPQRAEGMRLEGWDYVLTVPARGDDIYHVIAPTLQDEEPTCFFVSAMTSDPLVYFDSNIECGTSIDNLAPQPPTGVYWIAPGMELAWDEPLDEDFNHFTVYGSPSHVFDPQQATICSQTVETYCDVTGCQHGYYHITATDFAGNESAPSTTLLHPSGVGSGPGHPTGRLVLYQNTPNPLVCETQIAFDLPAPSHVVLTVLDVTGREVERLIDGPMQPGAHSVTWRAGTAETDGPALSGVYFYRLEAGESSRTRKMLLTTQR